MSVEIFTIPVVTVSSANTAVPLYSTTFAVTSIIVAAEFTNVGNIVVGGSNVLPSTGIEIPPGDTATITADQTGRGATEEFFVNQVYINSSTSGNKCRISGFKRQP
jgi:hypothetical protein